jgi:hypothetical protein
MRSVEHVGRASRHSTSAQSAARLRGTMRARPPLRRAHPDDVRGRVLDGEAVAAVAPALVDGVVGERAKLRAAQAGVAEEVQERELAPAGRVRRSGMRRRRAYSSPVSARGAGERARP